MDYRKIEKLESCPYNSSHQILPHRMAKHIIKCKKNYPAADMKVCIFNAVHVVPTHQYQAHLLECEDRQLVERELFNRPPVMQKSTLIKTEATTVDVLTKHDDWESDCVQKSYSPEEHIIYKEFTRVPPPGLSKGARKQWRLDEIERVNRLKSGMLVGDPQSDTSLSWRSGSLVNSESGASSAVPKLQDKKVKCDSSSGESDMKNGQVSQKDRQPHVAGAVPNPAQPAQACSFENGTDRSQILQTLKDKLDMTNFIKEKRKLEKKLFEIKKLEEMKNLNKKLTDQEESKILLKPGILEQLSHLIM